MVVSYEGLNQKDLKDFLDEMVVRYNRPGFISLDPISIPHLFSDPNDQEIAGLFASLFAWGNRKTIISKTHDLMDRMDQSPGDFVRNASHHDLSSLKGFVHRTFNGTDIIEIVCVLSEAMNGQSLESLFLPLEGETNTYGIISRFYSNLSQRGLGKRGLRHFSDPSRGSAAKRLNMFLRWMVRRDGGGVDLGIWDSISMSQLSCPLDVHSGKIARKLGILNRKQNDWKAVEELDTSLRALDPEDPVKYDFALFGLSAMENF